MSISPNTDLEKGHGSGATSVEEGSSPPVDGVLQYPRQSSSAGSDYVRRCDSMESRCDDRVPFGSEEGSLQCRDSVISRRNSSEESPREYSSAKQAFGPFISDYIPDPDAKNILDIDRPEEWALRHHLDNLIFKLNEPKAGWIQSARAFMPKCWTNSDRNSDDSTNSDNRTRFRISFAEVQRMRIRKLQCLLVKHVVQMRLTGTESAGWEQTLEEYIKALQHHDYMEKRSTSARDPFLATGEYAIDNYVLKSYIDEVSVKHVKAKTIDSLGIWEDLGPNNESICGTRSDNIRRTWWTKFKERIILAAVGGAFLIGPMWIMVLLSGHFTSLICTTACVVGFGILMAYHLEDGKDVLGSTAAYAAVLVVFVGTSS